MEYYKGLSAVLYTCKQSFQHSQNNIGGDTIRNYKITALCLCTIIGAGFATGRELVSYFVSYGITGFAGIFISSLLFSLIINKTMSSPCKSLCELLAPFSFGKAVYFITGTFLIVLYSAMIRGGGEVLKLIFNIDPLTGTIITALLSTLVILKGCISDISNILFIPICIIIFIISITLTGKGPVLPPAAHITLKGVVSPLIYVSYNMLTAIPLLITIPDKHLYRNCGRQTSIVIFILSAMLMLPLYTGYGNISHSVLPLSALLKGNIKYLYEFMLLIAIFSTAVSSGWGFVRFGSKPSLLINTVFLNISALIISLLGFETIVDKVYFIFGICGILLCLALFISPGRNPHT